MSKDIEDIVNNMKVTRAIFTDTYWNLIKECEIQEPRVEIVENIKTNILDMMNKENPTLSEGLLGISYALVIALQAMDGKGIYII